MEFDKKDIEESAKALLEGMEERRKKSLIYDIKETHIIFDEGLKEICVLWADKDDLRATYMTTEPTAGHGNINPNDELNWDLFQKVAGYGIYLDAKRKKKYFNHLKNWSI